MATDVAGYSRLMGKDESGTLSAYNRYRGEIIDPNIAEFGGRTVRNTGDGALVEFPSVVGAVECAVAIQRGLAERNTGVPAEKRIDLRIGINLGDIIVEGGDIFGDGVNIAARLEQLAAPGGICISEDAYRLVRDKLAFDFADLGEQALKNIMRPVRAYALAIDGKAPPDDLAAARALLSRPAIAVLPFQNTSGTPDQDYFADGITEEIITALARWRDFPVIARNSSFAYKGKAIDVVRVAKELGARYVLEGGLRRAAGTVRVTVQLIDGLTGHNLWAERYDRELADIFALQDEISEKVASQVTPALQLAETRRIAHKQPGSLDAWDHYLRAMAHHAAYTPAGHAAAERELETAIALAPDFAAAHAKLANVCMYAGASGWRDRAAAFAKGVAHAQRAKQLDEFDAVAQSALASAYAFTGRAEAGISAARRAISLNPNLPQSWFTLGVALTYCGQPAEALEPIRRGIALGPREPGLWLGYSTLAHASYQAGRYEDCVEAGRRAQALAPDQPRPYGYVAAALAQLGRAGEARAEAARARRLWPDFGVEVFAQLPYRDYQRELLCEGLRKAGLIE